VLRLHGRQRLRVTMFYDNHAANRFFTPRTLAFEGCEPNQQFRTDVLDPSAPVDAMGGRAILATLLRDGLRRSGEAPPSRRRSAALFPTATRSSTSKASRAARAATR
jgi:hypothetical protein